MDWSTNKSAEALYSALQSVQSLRSSAAASALDRGASNIQQKNYEAALASFKQAVAYKPDLLEAHLYLARTQDLLGHTEEAITAYQKALKVDPNSADARSEYAQYAMKNGHYAEAEAQFRQILQTNSRDLGAIASLGHIYMETGRLDEAEAQFRQAITIKPTEAPAYYSLGLLYNKQERYDEAVTQFTRATDLRRDYAMAYADLAYAYFGMGDKEMANEQVAKLYDLGTSEGDTLAAEVEETMFKPAILYQDIVESTFPSRNGPRTELSDLDESLATPGATKTFSMVFRFNTEMNVGSILKKSNWWISKANGGEAGYYNYGAHLNRENEVGISPVPMRVSYNPLTKQATVYFNVTQNEAGTGIMDPSHWVFRFSGVDSLGRSMDPDGDEYDRAAFHPF